MAPRYASRNHEECQQLRPPRGALKGMFAIRPPPEDLQEDRENVDYLFGDRLDAGPAMSGDASSAGN